MLPALAKKREEAVASTALTASSLTALLAPLVLVLGLVRGPVPVQRLLLVLGLELELELVLGLDLVLGLELVLELVLVLLLGLVLGWGLVVGLVLVLGPVQLPRLDVS